jgi:hypothetical protein
VVECSHKALSSIPSTTEKKKFKLNLKNNLVMLSQVNTAFLCAPHPLRDDSRSFRRRMLYQENPLWVRASMCESGDVGVTMAQSLSPLEFLKRPSDPCLSQRQREAPESPSRVI